MRTGTRCTTFVKLPVALSGGSSANFAPVAALTLSTLPFAVAAAVRVDLDLDRLADVRSASCVSLKFAVTHTPVSATIVSSGWPACTSWPTSTCLRDTMPAAGAVTRV